MSRLAGTATLLRHGGGAGEGEAAERLGRGLAGPGVLSCCIGLRVRRTPLSELPGTFRGTCPALSSPEPCGSFSSRSLSAGFFFSTGFRRPLHPAGPASWPSWGLALVPFPSGVSSFCLEPAPALPAPGDTTELFTRAWDDVQAAEVVPILKGACGSVLAAGLRARGDVDCDSLADGLACSPSVLGWQFGPGVVAEEGLPGA